MAVANLRRVDSQEPSDRAPADAGASGGSGGSGGTTAGGGAAGVAAAGAPASPTDAGAVQDLCQGPADALIPTTDGSVACPEALAARYFRFALCTCTTVQALQVFTDSFDSTMPPIAYEPWGASVGLNNIAFFGSVFGGRIGGSMTLRSLFALSGTRDLEVQGDLRMAAGLGLSNGMQVGRDAWIQGTLTGAGTLQVARDVYAWNPFALLPVPPLQETIPVEYGGTYYDRAFQIAQPCACEAADRQKIVDHVTQAASLAADEGKDPAGPVFSSPTAAWTIPCGRHYVDAVQAEGDLAMEVEGHSALFVGGDLDVAGTLSIQVEPGASLDLLVAGSVRAGALGHLGDPGSPQQLRIYTVGPTQLSVEPGAPFGAALYAPQTNLSLGRLDTLSGSVVVAELSAVEALELHYDRAITDISSCPPADTGCEGCEQCGGLACVAGVCRACATDADCCAPWVCHPDGQCAPLGS